MTLLARLRSVWRGVVRRGEVEAGMAEEFRHHIELRTRDLIRSGLAPAKAARQARLEFGHIESHREDARASRGLRFFDRIGFSWLDVKLGLRMLVKYPGLTIVGGLGIAVGVAVSVGFFAVLYSYVYPTLPLEDGDRIVALENRNLESNNEERRSVHDFFAWRDELRSVEELGAFRTVDRNLIAGEGAPELVQVAEMTAAGFDVARVPPLLGRYLLEDDEGPGATPVVVIGYDVWRARFGGDTGIVGRQVRIGTAIHTIVGVMPEGFGFPFHHQYWTALHGSAARYGPLEGPEIYIFGRLSPGASMEEAQAELDVVGQRAAATWPVTHARLRPMVMPYTYSLTDIQGITLAEVAGMQFTMTLLLLIVAVNVAVLFHARTAMRRGEVAVRSALGAGRGRIVGQLFAEALVLSLLASGLGLLLAQVGGRFGYAIMEGEAGGLPFWSDYSLQPATVALTIGLAVIAAVIVGVVPALQATGRGLQADLRQLSGGTGLRLGRTWTVLIVAQVAIAVAALPVAVHMSWTEIQGTATRPAYAVEDYAIATLLPEVALAGDAAMMQAEPLGVDLSEVLRRLEADPAIRSATYTTSLPDRPGRIQLDDAAGEWIAVRTTGLGAGYLEAVATRVIAGRPFGSADFSDGGANVVVNRTFVRKVLGGDNAVGRRIRHPLEAGGSEQEPRPGPWLNIVGVIDDLERNTVDPDLLDAIVYYPVAPHQTRYARLLLHVPGTTPATVADRTRTIVAAVDPTLWLGRVRSFADVTRQEETVLRLVALVTILVLISVFLLSAAGIYAMTSFTVTRRRKEIGIRVALGADAWRVLRAVFSRAGAQIGAGIAIGMASALALNHFSNGELLGARARVLLPAFALAMALVALLATLGPARRGLRVQPTDALRQE